MFYIRIDVDGVVRRQKDNDSKGKIKLVKCNHINICIKCAIFFFMGVLRGIVACAINGGRLSVASRLGCSTTSFS